MALRAGDYEGSLSSRRVSSMMLSTYSFMDVNNKRAQRGTGVFYHRRGRKTSSISTKARPEYWSLLSLLSNFDWKRDIFEELKNASVTILSLIDLCQHLSLQHRHSPCGVSYICTGFACPVLWVSLDEPFEHRKSFRLVLAATDSASWFALVEISSVAYRQRYSHKLHPLEQSLTEKCVYAII